MASQSHKFLLFPRTFSWHGLHLSLLVSVITVFIATTTFAQSYSPSSIPAVPDSRKPGSNIQPSQTSGAPPVVAPPKPAADPKPQATTWSNEGLFSQSTQFAFQSSNAEH